LRPFSERVKSLEQFIIPFSGLKLGFHRFGFRIDNTFFDAFEYAEIKSGLVDIGLSMEKKERMLLFDFTIHGSVDLPCDRCGEMVDVALDGEQRLIVKMGDTYQDEGEDVIIIPDGDNHFDVSSYLYEVLHLMVPPRRVHPETGGVSICNAEVLKKLEKSGTHSAPDPRWEALNKLKTNHKSKI
jgi:uncharacterized metal-binding protein YceD (DUF177 family)